MAAFNKFNSICSTLLQKKHNFDATDVVQVYLTNTAPVATNTVYNTPADLSTSNGYTARGNGQTTAALAGTTTITVKLAAAIGTWTFSGAKTFQYAVAFNETAAADDLIGWWDYGSAVVTANGDTFAITGLDTSLFTLA